MSFKRLDPEDFVVSADSVQGIAWSTGAPAPISWSAVYCFFFNYAWQVIPCTPNFFAWLKGFFYPFVFMKIFFFTSFDSI